jgi:hypothetical protein
MPKLKHLGANFGGVSRAGLVNYLEWQLRRNGPFLDQRPMTIDKQNRINAVLLSIRSEREVRLTSEDWPDIKQMPADAYLYDPKTHTLKETD